METDSHLLEIYGMLTKYIKQNSLPVKVEKRKFWVGKKAIKEIAEGNLNIDIFPQEFIFHQHTQNEIDKITKGGIKA